MIDTHCHLVDPQFRRDHTEVCKRAQTAGISFIINAGYDAITSQAALSMYNDESWLLPAVGIHPNEVAEESIKKMIEIEEIVRNHHIFAIGETGLDFYRNTSPQAAQKELFKLHIQIAKKYDLPLLIHTRNSIDDAIAILEKQGHYHGVFHCYSGTQYQAKRILDLGFFLGFGGILTFSKNMRAVFKTLPIDHVVLETDAPFLSPVSHRGQRNEPAYIFETLHSASGILDKSPEYLERAFDENAGRLFSINA